MTKIILEEILITMIIENKYKKYKKHKKYSTWGKLTTFTTFLLNKIRVNFNKSHFESRFIKYPEHTKKRRRFQELFDLLSYYLSSFCFIISLSQKYKRLLLKRKQ